MADDMPVVQRLIALPPEFDGATGYIDDVEGGHEFTLLASEFPEATARVDLRIGANCTDAFSFLNITAEGYKPYTQHGILIRAGIDRQIRVGIKPDPNRQGDTILPPLVPLMQTVSRALVGPVRVVNHNAARTHSYADDSGPRRVLFCSWFCALRDWRDDQAAATAVLDKILEAGYQGIRLFRVLGESDTSGYFAGRSVLPEWSVGALIGFLHACEARKLRVQLTCGRQWGTVERMNWERQCAETIQNAGLAEVITLWEGDNEGWQNAPMRDSDEQIAFYGKLFAMLRSTLRPAPLCACGAPLNEDPVNLYRWSTHSDVLEKHGMRDQDRCVKRAFTPWYWEGQPGHFPVPMWEGEPIPPPHHDAFMGCDKPGRVFATLAMNQLVGAAVTYFSGEAVRGRDPTTAEGFYETPKLMLALPEDVAMAGHVPGGNIWWWQLVDGRFATVCDAEYWGPNALAAPKPVKSYEVIGPGWTVRAGTGQPVITPEEKAALVVGEWA